MATLNSITSDAIADLTASYPVTSGDATKRKYTTDELKRLINEEAQRVTKELLLAYQTLAAQ